METEQTSDQILAFFSQNWSRVREGVLQKGFSQAFYPRALPEYDDPRFIDTRLPAVYTDRPLGTLPLVNPSARNFFGILLQETPPQKEEEEEEEGHDVTVIYLGREGTYSVSCLRETMGPLPLLRYTFLSIPRPITAPEEELRKAYKNLESLLRK